MVVIPWLQSKVDLEEEVEAKIAKNADRNYRPLPNSVLVKSDDGPRPALDVIKCRFGGAHR